MTDNLLPDEFDDATIDRLFRQAQSQVDIHNAYHQAAAEKKCLFAKPTSEAIELLREVIAKNSGSMGNPILLPQTTNNQQFIIIQCDQTAWGNQHKDAFIRKEFESAGLKAILLPPGMTLANPPEKSATDFIKSEKDPIPHGVYWSSDLEDFCRDRDNSRCGIVFYRLWSSRRSEFPQSGEYHQGETIPTGIYFSRELWDFCDKNGRLRSEFYKQWESRIAEFPQSL
jgi:hypothetical protein